MGPTEFKSENRFPKGLRDSLRSAIIDALFPAPNQSFQKTYEISEIGPVYLDWGKKRVKNSKGKIVRVSTFKCFISKTDRALGVLYQEGQQASYLGQMGRRIQRSI